jgi:hypothetical protein
MSRKRAMFSRASEDAGGAGMDLWALSSKAKRTLPLFCTHRVESAFLRRR